MSSTEEGGKLYLLFLVHRLLNFRLAEVESVADLVTQGAYSRQAVRLVRPQGGNELSPFWYINLPSDVVAREVVANCVLVKGIYELWGEGPSFEVCLAAAERFPERQRWADSTRSLKVLVDTWGHKLTTVEQLKLIEALYTLQFKGPIRLRDPDVTYRLIITDVLALEVGMPEDIVPPFCYFGREVAYSNRHIISQYGLPARAYIGPTSMDTEMAFVMAAQAQVRKGSFVYDPFVGTGSCLVAAAVRGAQTFGSDIDVRVVRDGKIGRGGKEVTVWSNFSSYGLPEPFLLRADAHRTPFRDKLSCVFDAIICDPPYGVRAGGRKSVSRTDLVMRNKETHIPKTDPYTLRECLGDLLACAALLLKVGGRLVFFQPSLPETDAEAEMARHPALKVLSNCEQSLTKRYGRRLICMQKMRECSAQEAREGVTVPPLGTDAISQAVFSAQPDQPTYNTRCRGKVC